MLEFKSLRHYWDTQRGVRYFYRNVEFELSQSALRFEKALLQELLIEVANGNA